MNYYLYQIKNIINNKIYIGVHKTDNIDDGYMGSGKILKRAIKKYGAENFEKTILKTFDSEKEMFNAEAEIVNAKFLERDDVYNIATGGCGGWEYINSIGKNLYGENGGAGHGRENLYTYDKMKAILIERGEWEKYKKSVSEGLKRAYDNGMLNGFAGKTHTAETRKKISEKNKISMLGSGNPNFGKMWISNIQTEESMRINREDFDLYLNSGWVKGRNVWKRIKAKAKNEEYKTEKVKYIKEIKERPIKSPKSYEERKAIGSMLTEARLKKVMERAEERKAYAEALYLEYTSGNYSSIRDFVRRGKYDKSHVSLTKLWKQYITEYNN